MWITDLHPILLGALQIAALGVPACALAWLVQRAAIPGGAPAAAIVGGIVAGLLIGATVGGRVAPEAHDRLFVGGVDETIALAELQSAHTRERMVLQATGVSVEAMPELEEEQRQEMVRADEGIDKAQWTHRERLRRASSIVFAVLVAIGLAIVTPWAVGRQWRSQVTWAPLVGMAMSAALVLVTALWMGLDPKRALPFAVAMATTGLSRRLLRSAAGVLGAAAFVTFVSALQSDDGWWVVVCGAVAGFLLGGPGLRSDVRGRRVGRVLLNPVVLPICVALLASVIDLPELVGHGRFWWLLALGVVASSDLRWVCYWAAIRGTARQWWAAYPWSIASRWMRDGAATVQIVLAFLAFGIDRNMGDVIAALLAGAAVIELTRNLRSRLAAALDRGSLGSLDDDARSVS